MLKFLKNIWKTKGQQDIVTPLNETATFEIKYKDLLVGTLSLSDGIWIFEYSEAFKAQDKINPITNFPNIHKVYKSHELYPFFVQRIPSLKQPKVQEEVKRKNIDPKNEVALLKHFGQNIITNSFKMYAV